MLYMDLNEGNEIQEAQQYKLLENNTPKQSTKVSRILNPKNIVQVNHIYNRIVGNGNTKYNKWMDQDVDVIAPNLVVYT